MMNARSRSFLSSDMDELAAAPLAVKDALRGLRRKLAHLPTHPPLAFPVDEPFSPLALAASFIQKASRMAALGEDLARDMVLHHRDEARIMAFAASGFSQTNVTSGERLRHAFVVSRYAAAKRVLARLGHSKTQVFEQPIDKVYRTLRIRFNAPVASSRQPHEPDFNQIAATAIELAQSGVIASLSHDALEPPLATLVFASLGLAEAVLALSGHQTHDTTLAAITLSADVMGLRKANLATLLQGFDPEAQLAAEFRLLAPALAEH
jgi:hypothetical protein